MPVEGLRMMTPDMRTPGALGEFESNVGSASRSIHRAEIPVRSPAEDNTIQDQLSSWMYHSGNLENMWFDDDLLTALMDPIMMPGVDNHSADTAITLPSTARAYALNTNMPSESEPQSPPNEASEEDRWPYSWDPGSRPITACKPIQMDKTHPLRQNHNTQFDISAERYKALKSFLQRPARKGFDFHNLPLPGLGIANVFIQLFFTHFEHQVPVIHRPSFKSSDNLPDPLLAIMIAIGATYSQLRHSCRFSIVLIDVARLSTQLAIEQDNRMMRDPMVLYALALICYSGIWCGNKRLFELCESLRGTVITYCRHMQQMRLTPSTAGPETSANYPDEQWHRWILRETKKRLAWVIYGLDCIFPCLLYLPASFTLAEFMNIECPCDEEFWQAATAQRWKLLLGSASIPPTRTFASAVSPFLGPLNLGRSPETNIYTTRSSTSYSNSIGLNCWSRHLVLITIQVQIFELSQQIIMVSDATLDTEIWQPQEESSASAQSLGNPTFESSTGSKVKDHYVQLVTRCSGSSPSGPVQEVLGSLAKRKAHLESMLLAWEQAFAMCPAADSSLYPTSKHFQTIASTHLEISYLMLHVPISDIQDALGKSGQGKVIPAMEIMRRSLAEHPDIVASIFRKCLSTVSELQSKLLDHRDRSTRNTMEPASVISCFLSGVYAWAILRSSDREQVMFLQEQIPGVIGSDTFSATVKEVISWKTNEQLPPDHLGARTNLILHGVADVLGKMAPWSASLNMALLLCHRAKELMIY
ncbi:hypothetical protein PEBR_10657 [Penicillium brasilianum]|uniref:Xylanolytic transcriptional activator regulatory domain-containing protein n=1 Tax=Penicillium brasilianum TaxID=104259 RepID=A0A1S9RUC4_PENBI|nr:hypothetical protein PEBR_10657 [Penicillium brasilianum]